MKEKILIIIVIVLVIGLVLFAAYNYFFDRDKTLGQETFFIASIEKTEGIEEIRDLLLVDIPEDGSSLQIVMIPVSIHLSLSGLSQMRISQLYPFGGSSIILEAFSQGFGLDPGYYFTVEKRYFDSLLEEVSPLSLNFTDALKFDDQSFPRGEDMVDHEAIISFLDYDYQPHYSEEFARNKAHIFDRALKQAAGSLLLLDRSSPYFRSTNMDDAAISRVNNLFLTNSVYFCLLDTDASSGDISDLESIILSDQYKQTGIQGIERFYDIPASKEPVQEEEPRQIEEPEPINKQDLTIVVFNGNFIPGSATATAQKIEELGYSVSEVGNAAGTYDNTLIFYKPLLQEFAYEIGDSLGVEQQFIQIHEDEAEETDIIIIVGSDYQRE